MQSKNSILIKERFKEYAIRNNFKYQDSMPIIAPQNSKLLFNISGGVIFQDELLEKKNAVNKNVASIQKCLRTDNLNSIGVSGRHHILFNMLGHFMFYNANEKETKNTFIEFAYSFLTKELQLDDKRIFVTVHPDDIVTANVWKKLGKSNLIETNKNIFISPYANKSALRTEILWRKTDNSLVELWNLVFTQFDSKVPFEKTSIKIAADSGVSLERIVSAIENKNNNYENSMWNEYVNYIKKYGNGSYDISQYRRIADLSNASIELIREGIQPGNKIQSYMLRKLMRTFFDLCDFDNINPEKILNYNKLDENCINVFKKERIIYFKSIQKGLIQAKKQIDKFGIENLDKNNLKSTYGLSEMYISKIISRIKHQNKVKNEIDLYRDK